MDLTSGAPYWPIKNGLLGNYPILKQDLDCEVAIIGGGITGALVAHYLVGAGIDTVLLDKRDIGWGSTSASTALLQYEVDTHLSDLIEMVGEKHAVRSYLLCLESLKKLEKLATEIDDTCDFEAKQSLYLASSRRDVAALERECEVRQKYGIRVDFLDQPEIESRFPFSKPAGLLSYDAAQIDAYRLTHKLIKRANQRGLRVFDRTAVAGIEQIQDGMLLTTERGCRVKAHKIVFASGYETQRYLKQHVTTLKSTYAFISEPLASLEGWYERCLIWESARPYFYLRTTNDDRVLVGGEDEPFRDPLRRDKLLGKKTKRLRERFGEMFPALELDVAYSWTGTFGETKDGLAYIGETQEFPNAYFALGYGGNGITYSLIAAELIRDLYLGHENDDLQIFRFDR